MKRIKGMMLLLAFACLLPTFGCGGGATVNSLKSPQTASRNEILSASSIRLSSGSYGIIYRFVAEGDGEATIVMASKSLRCRLSLTSNTALSGQKKHLFPLQSASDTDGNASISFNAFGKNVYYLTASTDVPNTSGVFRLTYPTSLILDGYETQILN